MTKDTPESSAGAFHAVHAERDLQSNWEVDLAKKLEEYLLKICSGEITGEEHVNFAEAALLLQGSIQVYSRKVEYLYNLVLRALEFLSQKRQSDPVDGESVQPDEAGPSAVAVEENDQFWGLDDIPVDEKNSLDNSTGKEVNLDQFIKPPANLVVLEGDCLDTGGDGGELESYLLSTTDLYQDFILLDMSDAVAVDEFMKGGKAGTTRNGTNRATTTRKSFLSPRRSGGSAHKSVAKSQRANSMCSPKNFNFEDKDARPNSPASAGFDNGDFGPNMDDGFDTQMDADNSDVEDEDDPWKPLNPHEPGNLKVKPFRKVKASRKIRINVRHRVSMSTLFPLAKLHGPISPELTEMWEMRRCAHQRQKDSQSTPPLYEKLRQSLINDGNETGGAFLNTEDDNDDNEWDNGNPEIDMPGNDIMDEDLHPFNNEHEVDDVHANADEAVDLEFPDSQTSLEDLCRSHLNALLASIAETEKQTEMAARVSTWKQRIEHNLQEQESHPPFDIRDYGEKILDKLSLEESSGSVLPFSDLVKGQVKYDVSRSFSSLLQLVNNGEVDLQRHDAPGESFCYTSVNPFQVRLLKHDKRQEVVKQFGISKKRAKSPTKKPSPNGEKKIREKSPTKKPSPEGEKKTRREKSPTKKPSQESEKKSRREKSPTKKTSREGEKRTRREKSPTKKPSPEGEKRTRREKSPTKKPSQEGEKQSRREKSPTKKPSQEGEKKSRREKSPTKKPSQEGEKQSRREKSPTKKPSQEGEKKSRREKSPTKKPSQEGEKQSRREKSPTKKPSQEGEKKSRREKSPTKKPSPEGEKRTIREKSPTKKSSPKGEKKTRREKSPISSSSMEHGPTGLTSPTNSSSSSRKHGRTGLTSPTSCKFSVNLGKASAMKFSPQSKRRRRSPLIEPVNVHSAG